MEKAELSLFNLSSVILSSHRENKRSAGEMLFFLSLFFNRSRSSNYALVFPRKRAPISEREFSQDENIVFRSPSCHRVRNAASCISHRCPFSLTIVIPLISSSFLLAYYRHPAYLIIVLFSSSSPSHLLHRDYPCNVVMIASYEREE